MVCDVVQLLPISIPAKKRSNLKVEVKAHVKQINFDGKKAIGISYWKNDELITVKANKEVILSAGSIGSPHILQTSGIGDEKKLRRFRCACHSSQR
jgi:choline dehydrogenase